MDVNIEHSFRLSPQQRRLWHLLESGVTPGRAAAAVRLAGPLDRSALRAALREVLGRHEVLRTRLRRLSGLAVPAQIVEPETEPVWQEHDLAFLPAEEREARSAEIRDVLRVLDPETGPTLSAALLALASGSHLLLLSVSGFCADGASLEVIVRHLASSYRAIVEGGSVALPSVRYVQFAEWQNRVVEMPEDEDGPAFRGSAGMTEERQAGLPFRLPRESWSDFRPYVVPVPLPEGLSSRLPEVAEALGGSWESLVLAGWQALLWRFLDQREPIIAHLDHGRGEEVLREAVGLYAKWLPLAGRIDAETSFADLVRSCGETLEAARGEADGFLWPERAKEAPGSLLYPAFGIELREAAPLLSAAGVTFTLAYSEARLDGCELALAAVRRDGRLALELVADGGRFRREDIETLAESLGALLAAAEDPRRTIGALGMVSEARLSQLRARTEPHTLPLYEPIYRRFCTWAGLQPEAPALVAEDTVLTYGELFDRSSRFAGYLRSLGVGPEVPVALCMERSADLVVALLGILASGGAYAPIDPKLPAQRLGFILEDLQAPVVVTQARLAERLAAPPGRPGRIVCFDADQEAIARARPLVEDGVDAPVPPESLAYVIFTSGSTGRPKGVCVEHRQLAAYVDAVLQRLDLPPGASYATVSTFAADLGHTAIFPAFASGGCLHVLSESRATDPAAFAAYLSQHRVDCLKIVPSHLESLMSFDSPSLVLPARRLVLGGEASRREWLATLFQAAPADLVILNHYGPTETTVGAFTHRAAPDALDPRVRTLPLGRPLPHARAYLLDRELQPLPLWMPGEICIAGAGVSRGYLGRPDLTAERFVPDPLTEEPGARMYQSGDLARALPGELVEFLARVDSQVKFHGFRVELEEIRSALNRHPKVRDSVIRLLRDDHGRDVLVAYYAASQEIEPDELRATLAERILEETLPNFFVHLKRIPLTLNGKVNRDALPTLEQVMERGRRELVAPRTPVEELLVGIWESVLGVPRISVQDSFFALGGHSLLATQLVSRIRQALGVELSLRDLFESPTVEGLAERTTRALRGGMAAAVPALTAVPRIGDLPLSFAQERLWVMHQLDPEGIAYNVIVPLRLRGQLDLPALQRSFTEVVRRHEILRTRFPAVAGRPSQVIDPASVRPAPRVDLSRLPAELREAESRRLIEAQTTRSFDLERGPLASPLVLKLDERDHRVILVLHHIVSDGWSMGVLVREIGTLYAAFTAGRQPMLPELPIQYADFASWQRRWLQGEALEAQLAYWRTRLANAPGEVPLPYDFPYPEKRSLAGSLWIAPLSPELSASLVALSRREGATLFMTLLTAFKVLLARCCGMEDVSVGTDIANRNWLETEGLIGFFVNNLVLRTNLSGNPTFLEALQRVKLTTLGAYAHQDLPFDRLVRELRVRRDPRRTPLFNVLFVVQNAPRGALELPGVTLEAVDVEFKSSKFDLAVFVIEAGDRLLLRWTYGTSLFREATIVRLAQHLERLLEHAVRAPETRVSQLDLFDESEKEQRAMETRERQESKLQALNRPRRKAVSLSRVSPVVIGMLDGGPLPLLVQPAVRDVDLTEWASIHRDTIESQLASHGAILFRGFGLRSVPDFERFAQAVCPDLYGEYGDLPRENEGERIYQSTPYPPSKTILFHNESSHLNRWPMKQMFFCVQAARAGGETPIVDCRRIYERLDPAIRGELERLGLAYIRHFIEGFDVGWEQFFRTSEPAEVERRCRLQGMECEWRAGGLRTLQRSPAVLRHPRTREAVFFNQIQLHHPAFLDPEVRQSATALFGPDEMPRDVRFGDGSVIPDGVVKQIEQLYWDTAVSFPWQEGDVLLVDNMLVAHARNPFEGSRKIAVAMGELIGRGEVESGLEAGAEAQVAGGRHV